MYALEFIWNPSKGIDVFGLFTLRYYSMMWLSAFILGYFITKHMYKREKLSLEFLDTLFLYTILGIIIGARLGHVIFYQPELFRDDFFSIFLPFSFKNGFSITGFQGLASHGAAIGVIFSMYLYNKRILKKSILWILDRLFVSVALGCALVRIGNFINSEIVGEPTNSIFGVVFKQLNEDFARHPAQLYEAAGYFIVFLILWVTYFKTKRVQQTGFLFGLFMVLMNSVRFAVEYIKKSQGGYFEEVLGIFSTGQWLSLPLIILGLFLMYRSMKKPLNP